MNRSEDKWGGKVSFFTREHKCTFTFVVRQLEVLELPVHYSGGTEVWGRLADLGISRRHVCKRLRKITVTGTFWVLSGGN